MANLTVKIGRNFIEPSPERFLNIWAEEVTDGYQLLCGETAEVARLLAPVGITQVYEDSIDHAVERVSATKVIGSVFSTDEPVKAQVIEGVDSEGNRNEYGRQPGTFMPVDLLMLWVAFKFGFTDPAELDRVTFLVNRKIKERGITAVRPIEQAKNIKEGAFDRYFLETLPQKIAARF
jgi:hypothetical protein